MRVKFCGAVQSVTGSCHLITIDNHKILLDCGQFQGGKQQEALNFMDFPFDPEEIEAVVLSHAHIDHCGRIPLLAKRGFRGNIYCTDATADLLEIIYDAFYDDYQTMKAFLDSHSYTGNPTTCALAVETLNIFRDDNVLENNILRSQKIRQQVENTLLEHPHVDGFRQLGMITAIELVQDKKTKTDFDWRERVGYEIYKLALQHGVLLRPLGNVLYFLPPYIINDEEITEMVTAARQAIDEYFSRR